jgi:Raf kinase inhibitor-like YbhB/YbcL family protein
MRCAARAPAQASWSTTTRATHGAVTELEVSSPAFDDGDTIPARYTADGEKLSPPVAWRRVPPLTAAIVIIIEDADSPTPQPLVHGIVWGLPGQDGDLPEGGLRSPASAGEPLPMGRNSYLTAQYLPPDPPPGHGPHRYAFQVFALRTLRRLSGTPGRRAVVESLRENVLAKGCLIGVYERR